MSATEVPVSLSPKASNHMYYICGYLPLVREKQEDFSPALFCLPGGLGHEEEGNGLLHIRHEFSLHRSQKANISIWCAHTEFLFACLFCCVSDAFLTSFC